MTIASVLNDWQGNVVTLAGAFGKVTGELGYVAADGLLVSVETATTITWVRISAIDAVTWDDSK